MKPQTNKSYNRKEIIQSQKIQTIQMDLLRETWDHKRSEIPAQGKRL